MGLSADEQLLIELINRARLDPAAAAERRDHDLNEGLAPGTITTDAKQVLSPNDALMASALGHSRWMLATDTFSHTGAGGTSPSERMENNGFEFIGSRSWSYENIALGGSTAAIDRNTQIVERYVDLYESAGHRKATFAPEIREIGVSQEMGTYQGFNASILTENFGMTGTDVFVTGVVYQDNNRNDFYTIGEGRADYWFEVDGTRETTGSTGGYGIGTDVSDSVSVEVGRGKKTMAALELDLTQGNGKLDLVFDSQGRAHLEVSASATLGRGISEVDLLGVADLDIVGQKGRNTLTGNAGDNMLSGGKGADRLYGGAGDDRLFGDQRNDKLFGGAGDDRLAGGKGNDRLTGDEGRDTFVFEGGRDKVLDFEAGTDRVLLDAQSLGLRRADIDDVLDDASVRGGNLVLDFGRDGKLILMDVDNPNALGGDFDIV